ncbi:CYTH domain-containing protein [uncultured Paraglaciecola sp.]|uniref:CYTH domain-containing protein n=1 Tax=uncultured Paraglaciecola sp. TaxID=1765024 RepID=UPI0030DD51EC|tara:strand:- start:92659 stop:93669 length:1011 start_codon:yes stop_codon:yes gene_type:complete
MEYEIELKLLTNEEAGEVIETKLLPLLNASVTQQTLVLTNHYFDTPDRRLRQHDIGLRIRGNNQKYEQTLKTAGKSLGGLHQRPEYNVPLDESKKQSVTIPDLHLFPLSAWPKTLDVEDLQARLDTLFTTHFQRKVYLLEFSQGDIVELVWDLGEVTSDGKSLPICEVELELKKGDTKVLFDIAETIVRLMPTSIGTDSKAARGYRLLDGSPDKTLRQFPQPIKNTQTTAEEFSQLLSTLLQGFQTQSVEIRRQYSEELAAHIKHILDELTTCLVKFKEYFPSAEIETILAKVDNLSRNWSLVLKQNNKNEAHRLLTQPQTTQLQLDIVQCLVEQS